MKIISGGQIGADIAGIKAAKYYGYEVGGWMPKNFMTKSGPKPEYAELYGMLETHDGGYPARTRLNVQNSDVTIRYARNMGTHGEKLTARIIGELKKPHLDIWVKLDGAETNPNHIYLAEWLMVYKPQVINIAGNALEEIEPIVYDHFCKTLNILRTYGL